MVILKGITFAVGHEIFALLGANGAGKSTLLRTLARLLPLGAGTISFDGRDISSLPPHRLPAIGISVVPQEANVFPDLTVIENLSIGGVVGHRPVDERIDEIFTLFPVLRDRVRQRAGTLSGGESQMVAIGRALMQDPRLLLLDEPTAGLAPVYVDGLFERLVEIHNRGIAIVLAEQNAQKALDIADRAMVLSLGEVALIEDSLDSLDMDAIREGYGL